MIKLKVAAIQPDLLWEDHQGNRSMLAGMIGEVDRSVDLILLPEMFATAFSMNPDRLAEEEGGESLEWMKQISKERGCGIGGSLIVSVQGKHFNRFFLVEKGEVLATYDKRHLFRMGGEHDVYVSGGVRKVANFRGWRIALNICYDLRFPVFTRRTDEFDYDLLVNSANWPEVRISHWDALLPARAIENQTYVVGVNRVGVDANDIAYGGNSVVLDFLGLQIQNLEKSAGHTVAELDLDAVRTYREKFPAWQDADRFTLTK